MPPPLMNLLSPEKNCWVTTSIPSVTQNPPPHLPSERQRIASSDSPPESWWEASAFFREPSKEKVPPRPLYLNTSPEGLIYYLHLQEQNEYITAVCSDRTIWSPEWTTWPPWCTGESHESLLHRRWGRHLLFQETWRYSPPPRRCWYTSPMLPPPHVPWYAHETRPDHDPI